MLDAVATTSRALTGRVVGVYRRGGALHRELENKPASNDGRPRGLEVS